MKRMVNYLLVALLVAFGSLTIFLSTSVIFDLFDVREREGNYVLFIVWANFISSIIYFIAAYGLATLKKWTHQPLAVSSVILIIAFIGLQFYVHSGGVHEEKTIRAMMFRMAVTVGFTLYAYFTLNRKKALVV
jgi:hypothetical protein